MRNQKKRFLFYRFSRKIVELFFRLFYRMKVYGSKSHFVTGSAILAGNHVSFFDPPFVGVSWPEVVHYFARPTLFDKPVLGFLLRSYNVHPLSSKGALGAFKLVSDLLKKGFKVAIFPEGKRSSSDEIVDPKQGFVIISHKAQCPIIPVYVHGAYQIWSRHRKFPRLRGRLACVFGSPLSWDTFSHLGKKEAQEAMMTAWLQSMKALKQWLLDGAKGSPP